MSPSFLFSLIIIQNPHPHCTLLLAANSFHSISHTRNNVSNNNNINSSCTSGSACFKNLDDALTIFNELLHTRPLPPIQRFNKLLGQIAKMRHYPAAISLIHRLDLLAISNLKSDLCTHNIAINCFSNLNRVDLAFSLLGKIFKLGYQPNCATFNTLIRGLCLDGKLPRAVRFFDEAVTKGFQPDLITYGTLINGLCKIGNTRAAILLLKHMEQATSCQPDIVVYSTIIDSLCKDKQIKEALKVFSDMDGKGITPDVVTYTSLIEGLRPDSYTYNAMLNGLCKGGKLNEVNELLREMKEHSCSPSGCTYNIVVRGFLQNNETSEAIQHLQTMLDSGFSADASTLDLVFNLLSTDWLDPLCKEELQRFLGIT